MLSPHLIQACREVVNYTRPRDVVGPYRGTGDGNQVSGYFYILNPFGRYIRTATLRTKRCWRAGDKGDEKAELEAVTQVFVSLMVKIIVR